ncbi:MAG: hypothetical protein ABSB82_07075 [Terriglobia bacterium]|jgi:hypothetical protein
MKKMMLVVTGFLAAAAIGAAAAPERWLHVSVVSTDPKGDTVHINVPMSLAEKVLPAIHNDQLREGKVRIHGRVDEVDLRAIFEAVRTASDNEFVTVKNRDEDVRVAKSAGNLLIKVHEKHGKAENVEIKVPMAVVEAMLSGGGDEIDVAAGLRALSAQGDVELVSVNDGEETVHIWTDTRSSSER